MYYKNLIILEREMKNYLLSALLILSTGLVLADGHSAAEKEVISKISEYWDARNSARLVYSCCNEQFNLEC